MVAAGFSTDSGPVAVMLMDHEAGRAHVSVMAAKAGQALPGPARTARRPSAAARGYAELLRGHIRKEDHILYPMARMRLHEEALRGVDRDCAAFEARQVAEGADAVKELGRELVARHAGASGDEGNILRGDAPDGWAMLEWTPGASMAPDSVVEEGTT